MKDRNSSNLSVKLGDNQGAMKAAQALRDSSLVLSLNRHNRGSSRVVGRVESVGLSGCYTAVIHLLCYFVLSKLMFDFFSLTSFPRFISVVINCAGSDASLCQTE